MVWAGLRRIWSDLTADGLCLGTTWSEQASGRRIDQRRDLATGTNVLVRTQPGVWVWDSREQQAGIGMNRIAHDFFPVAAFNNVPGIHDHGLITEIAGAGQVMGNIDVRDTTFFFKVAPAG